MPKHFFQLLFCCVFSIICLTCFSQGRWTKKAEFPTSSRNFGVGFSVNNKGYYGMGQKQTKPFVYKAYTDLWEYDPEMNVWTQKSDFPGSGRLMMRGFTVNDKIYIGFGYVIAANGPNAGGNEYQTDLYEFDPPTNKWSRKNDSFLGRGDVFFVVNGNAYSVNPEYRTLNRYNPVSDTWFESKWEKNAVAPHYSNFTGYDIAFSAGEKEYIITTIRKKDGGTNQLWELDPNSITWKEKNDLPFLGNDTISAFSAGEKNYALRGCNEVLEYDPATDIWKKKNEIPAECKNFYPAFSIGERIYGFSKYEFFEFVP
jgi:N-acetylneuraminic acid mutarotase